MKKREQKTERQKGTALIVTLILAGAISLVAFGMTKITLNEVFVGGKSEEGLEAYYAAQAGIEDGLMRYKFYDKPNLTLPEDANDESNSVLRVYINKNGNDRYSEADRNTPPSINSNDYVYDLKIWSKEACPQNNPCEYDVVKDKSALFDVSGLSSVYVKWSVRTAKDRIVNITDRNEQKKAALWYRLNDDLAGDPRGLGRDFYTVLSYYNQGDNPQPNPNGISPILRGGGNISINQAKNLKFKAFLPETVAGLQASDYPLHIKIETGSNAPIGGPYVYIESTGYYGNTAKKIITKVDRESKSVIDVFDYVIYSGNGPLPR